MTTVVSSQKAVENGGNGALESLVAALRKEVREFVKRAKKIAKDDPRKIVHGFKVGVALVLVSLFYCLDPLYDTLGLSATWALLTVIVVFEYSVGATLGKGLNRMIATCLGGFLGVGACHLALLSGNNIAEPVILLFFCFIVGAIVTFMRFFPELKARHDYGLMIFLLTFSLVTVSGYREDVLIVASKRLWMIIIGCFIAISVCIFVCPVWSGSELHSLIASNIDMLGSFMEGLADEYLDENSKGDKSFLFAHKRVLATQTNEETMANLARWEPGHGPFRLRHPWNQYLKIGNLTRQCAYKIDTLSNYLSLDSPSFVLSNLNNIIAEAEARDCIKEMIKNLSSETGKTLKELSRCINKMETPLNLSVGTHITETRALANELRQLLQYVGFRDGINPLDVLPVATLVSLLIETVTCVEKVAVAVHELCILARFKRADVVHDQVIKEADTRCPILNVDEPNIDVVVVID